MRAHPSALLRLAAGATIIVTAHLAPFASAPVFAETTPSSRFESTSSARIISDDPRIDLHLAVPVIERPSAVAATPAARVTQTAAAVAPALVAAAAPAVSAAAPAAPVAAAAAALAPAHAEPQQETASVGPAMRPLRTAFEPVAPAKGTITTYFGEVGSLSPRGHAGIDVAAPVGTPIYAMEDGEVVRADFANGAYGGLVVIAHAGGYETWYGHLSRLGVEPGEQIKRGDQIGRMGSTGMSTGSHLHFEVRQDGELRNPLRWLSEHELEK